MKKNNFLFATIAILSVFFLCAFAIVPSVQLYSNAGESINVAYHAAEIKGDTLTVTVNYNSGGAEFEIGKDIVVSAEKNMSKPFKILNSRIESGNYIYELDVAGAKDLNTIFVEAPILYKPTKISTVSTPLQTNKEFSLEGDTKKDDAGWFSVSSVELADGAEGLYCVRVTVESNSVDLPRFPKLQIEQMQVGGISALYFDENNNFELGVFTFYVPSNSREAVISALDNANIVVSDALVRIENVRTRASSGINALSVVVNQEN